MNSNSVFRAGGIFALSSLVVLATAFLSQGITKEIPVGRMEGQVLIPDGKSQKPLANAAILLRPVTQDEDSNLKPRFLRADKDGNFVARNLPAGFYDVEVSAKAHDLAKPLKAEVKLAETTKLTLKLEPMSPYLTLYANQHVFLPSEKPAIQLHGFVPKPDFKLKVFSVPTSAIVKGNGIYGAFQPLSNPAMVPDVLKNGDAKLISEEAWKPTEVDEEGTFREDVPLPSLATGFYWIQASGDNVSQGTYLLITNIGMAAKRDKNSVHVYVSDLQSGKSVPNAKIQLLRPGTEEPPATTTGTNGLATVSTPHSPTEKDSAILAQVGNDLAVCTFRDYEEGALGTKTLTYTDRPVYRPGDSVSFRSIMRNLEGSEYKLPTNQTANVKILTESNEIILSESKSVSSFGTIDGEFKLPEGATAPVRIQTEIGGAKDETYVSVSAYRKPAFKLVVEPAKPYYVRGDTIEYKVKAEYYFGGPVAGAKLTGSVFKSDLWRWSDPESDETEEYDSGYGEFLEEIESVTNDQGEAVIKVDSRQIKWGEYDQSDQSIKLTVSATEGTDQYFEGSGSTRLMRGEMDLRLSQDSWLVAPGVPARFTLDLVDPLGKPLANQKVTINSGYEVWSKNSSIYKIENRNEVTTNTDGKAEIVLTPSNPGDFRVEATILDKRGNLVKSIGTVWVWREGEAWSGREAPNLQVSLDKKKYQIGETATALVRTSKKGGQAWVTLETDTVLKQELVDLTSGIATVKFNVNKDLKPNAYVSVSYITGKEFIQSTRRLVVDLREERLDVTITPSAPEYQPGQEATFDVLVTDAEGKPVSAELSLATVDESIFALAEDTIDPIGYFYPMRYNRITTLNSFPELYLDGGEKDAKNVELRKDFRDTALWMPKITTNAEGRANVTLTLPDNLTEWRSTAVVVTRDSEFGKAIAKIKVNKPLMVRLIGPMYLTEGDTQNFSVAITNSTGSDLEPELLLTGKGLAIGSTEKKVKIAPGKTEILSVAISTKMPGDAVLEARIRDGKFSDGVELKIPVAAHGPKLIDRKVGLSDGGSTSLEFEIQEASEAGTLEVEVGNSPVSQLIGSIEELLDYPYGCVEQTLSRFVPALAIRQSFPQYLEGRPDLSAKIDQISERGLDRIQKMQSNDGGWGWFENESSFPGTTALALEGLGRAKLAGAKVPDLMLEKGLKWADQNLKTALPVEKSWGYTWAKQERFELAYACWFVTRDAYWIPFMRQNWAKEPTSTDLAMLYHATGDATVSAKLMKRASVRENLIFWEGYYGSLSSSRALEAIQQHQPTNPDLEKIALGILFSRDGTGWRSTLDSGHAIIALQSYLLGRGQNSPLSGLNLQLNGKQIQPDQIGTEDAGTIYRLRLPISGMIKGKNEIVIEGAGAYFYSASVNQTPFAKVISASTNPKISIQRTFHKLVPQVMENGSKQLVPGTALSRFVTGDVVRCVVEVDVADPMRFVMVEIPVPSNLKVAESSNLDEWTYWFSGMTILDDRVAQFATTLPAGKSKFEFNLRAEGTGDCGVLPARVEEMYSPDRSATTSSMRMEVTK